MAKFVFTVNGGGTKSVILPVSVSTDPILFTGLEQKSIPFTISNPLTRQVSFTAVKVLVEGIAAPKVSAVVRLDNIVIDPGASFDNFLDVESIEEMDEEELFSITVSAQEAVI